VEPVIPLGPRVRPRAVVRMAAFWISASFQYSQYTNTDDARLSVLPVAVCACPWLSMPVYVSSPQALL